MGAAGSALTRIGAVLVPLSTLLTPRELTAQLRAASVQFLVAVEEFRGHRYLDDRALAECRPACTAAYLAAEQRLANATGDDAATRIAEALTAVVTPSDPMVIIFTSGSSGPPKGVAHSHGSALGAVRVRVSRRGASAPTPGCTCRCRSSGSAGWAAECFPRCWPEPPSSPKKLPIRQSTLDLVQRERVTLFRGWPDQAEALARQAESMGTDFSSLRPGSLEALLPSDQRAQPGARAKLFGMTEAFGPYCGYPADTEMPRSAWGSCGKPFDGVEVRIVDPDTGAPAAAGTVGMIQIRGPHTSCAGCAGAAARTCSPQTGSTPPVIWAVWTTTASCSTTAGPTTCSRCAARLSIRARSKRRCALSTVSRRLMSPPSAVRSVRRWCATPPQPRPGNCARRPESC